MNTPTRKPRTSPGRRRLPGKKLNRETIVGEAIGMADAAGLEAVSMRNLAARLGAEAMSLYHHLPGKDALIDAMVDAVVGEIVVPRAKPEWRAEMRRRARSASRVFMRHPWACLPVLARINVGPRMLTYLDRTHGCLLRAGFSNAGADRARMLIDSHILGFVLQEHHFPVSPGDYAASARAFLPMLPSERYPDLRRLAEAVGDGAYAGRNSFDFGLDLILNGLARLLDGKSGKKA